jgi:hypothetical protein
MVKTTPPIALFFLLTACGAPDLTYRQAPEDAGTDVTDALAENADVATDSQPDAPVDSNPDVHDVATEPAPDSAEDVTQDTSVDVAPDTEQDVASDTVDDFSEDIAQDVVPDVLPDATAACAIDMVPVVLLDGTSFCIDRTEVTQQAYAAWLATSPDPTMQAVPCHANEAYVPSVVCGGYTPSTAPHKPVTCVDWCDAQAYCRALGKRLCGAVQGGETAYNQSQNAGVSQWMCACSAEGANQYPYVGGYQATACNGEGLGTGAPMDVGLATTCEGGSPGLMDMSGNVAEWEDCCDGAAAASNCRARGGSYLDGMNELRCRTSIVVPRNQARSHVGFRCCSD